MDSHSMNRKDFLKLTFTLIGGATMAAACSSTSSGGGSGGSSGTGGSHGTGGSNGAGGGATDAKVDTAPVSMCVDPLVTSQLSDSTGHMHMLVIRVSTLSATTDQTSITTGFPEGSGGHFHTVTLSVADLATLQAGGTVTKTSTMDGDPLHSHMYRVSCRGD